MNNYLSIKNIFIILNESGDFYYVQNTNFSYSYHFFPIHHFQYIKKINLYPVFVTPLGKGFILENKSSKEWRQIFKNFWIVNCSDLFNHHQKYKHFYYKKKSSHIYSSFSDDSFSTLKQSTNDIYRILNFNSTILLTNSQKKFQLLSNIQLCPLYLRILSSKFHVILKSFMICLLFAILFFSNNDNCILCGLSINSFHIFDFSCCVAKKFIFSDDVEQLSISCWSIWKTYCSILMKKQSLQFSENALSFDFKIGDFVQHIFDNNDTYKGYISNIIEDNIEVIFEDGDIISDMKSNELMKIDPPIEKIKPKITTMDISIQLYRNIDEFYQSSSGLSKYSFYQSLRNLPEKNNSKIKFFKHSCQ